MTESPEPEIELPASLKFLRGLVTALTIVMIVGMVLIVALIWSRYSDETPALPDTITLPDGSTPTAFTQGTGWFAVVTADNRILIYDQLTGSLRQTIQIEAAQ